MHFRSFDVLLHTKQQIKKISDVNKALKLHKIYAAFPLMLALHYICFIYQFLSKHKQNENIKLV